MTLTCIVGDRGTGKTLLSTILMCKEGKKIYANYQVKNPLWTKLEPWMLGESFNEPTSNGIDEASIWLESRTPGKKLDRYLSYILFQSRKEDRDFYLTMQLFGTIDLRFRELADYIILAERENDNKKDGAFIYTILRRSNTNPQIKKLRLSYEKAQKWFPLFDTNEKIPYDPSLRTAVMTDKRQLLPEVDEIIEQYFDDIHAGTVNKALVADRCLELGYDKEFQDLIYNRIKSKKQKGGRL